MIAINLGGTFATARAAGTRLREDADIAEAFHVTARPMLNP